MVRNLLLTMAEEFSRQLGERCKAALDATSKRGFAANKPPYGYRLERVPDPAGGKPKAKFMVVPEEAEVVMRIFEMRKAGSGYKVIATRLNDDGLPSRRGGSWDPSQVRSILFNERYLGHAISGTIRQRRNAKKGSRHVKLPREKWAICYGAHEAIVDDATWQAAHRHDQLGGKHPVTSSQSRHPLVGIMQCSQCGAGFIGNPVKSAGRTLNYYRCSYNRRRGETVCTNKTVVREDLMLEHVVDRIGSCTDDYESYVQEMIEMGWQLAKAEQEAGGEDPKRIKKQLEKLRAKMGRIGRRMADCPEEAGSAMRDELGNLSKERDRLTARLADIGRERPAPMTREEIERQIRKGLSESIAALVSPQREELKKAAHAVFSEIIVREEGKAKIRLSPGLDAVGLNLCISWRPHGDLNPSSQIENLMSWA